jgi:hypothetical protein
MTSVTVPMFDTQNHPSGQVTLSTQRNIAARASALAGYGRGRLPGKREAQITFTGMVAQVDSPRGVAG